MIEGMRLFAISVRLRQMAAAPVRLRQMADGTGSDISRQIKSTPAADRHRSVAPSGGGGNRSGATARDSRSGVPSRSQEYKQFEEYIGVPGG